MSEKQRKTLSLPVLAEGERRPPNPKRKPVRGFAGGAKRVPTETAEVNPPKPATSTDWRKGSSARRGERPGDQGATASTQRRPRPSSSPDGEKRPGERAPAGRSEPPRGNGRNERPFEPRGDRPARARDGQSVAGFKERSPEKRRERSSDERADGTPKRRDERPRSEQGERSATERGDRPPKRWDERTPSEHRERASTGRRERPPTEWGDRPPNRRGEQALSGPGGRPSAERGERPPRERREQPSNERGERRPSDKYADKPADRRPARPFSGQPAEKAVGCDSLPLNGPVEANRKPASVQEGIRVSKLLAERGICSRREADDFIVRGWVYADGQRISELGTRVDPKATLTLDKQARAAQQRLMTILLHKPIGYVSGQPEPGCQPASVLIRPENQQRSDDTPIFHASHLKGLAPAGRLDIDSTGLLVLTQDGRVARQLIGENSRVDKEYLVRVEGQLIDNGLALLRHGLSLDEKPLKPARVEWLNDDQLRFVLNEGRKRQIRRMCELVGLRVIGLKRVRIGAVRLGDLPLGQWRYLRENEVF